MPARRARSRGRAKRKKTGCCLLNIALFLLAAALAILAFVFVSSGCGHKARSSHAAANVSVKRHRASGSSIEPSPSAESESDSKDKASAPEKIGTTPSNPPPNSTLSEFSRGDADSPKIALTFDAGASAAPCAKILDVLAKRHVHSTFFLTGKWIAANPELVRRIADEGHEIGNHTYDHRRLTKLSRGDIADEVEKTDRLVERETGGSTKPLLRVPYGERDHRVLSILSELGYRSIYWDLDSWDSVKAGITPAEIESRVTGKVRNGSIVLMHCGSDATAEALDDMLDRLRASGYQPVKVSELMQNKYRDLPYLL